MIPIIPPNPFQIKISFKIDLKKYTIIYWHLCQFLFLLSNTNFQCKLYSMFITSTKYVNGQKVTGHKVSILIGQKVTINILG